jgi:hypothetical protein
LNEHLMREAVITSELERLAAKIDKLVYAANGRIADAQLRAQGLSPQIEAPKSIFTIPKVAFSRLILAFNQLRIAVKVAEIVHDDYDESYTDDMHQVRQAAHNCAINEQALALEHAIRMIQAFRATPLGRHLLPDNFNPMAVGAVAQLNDVRAKLSDGEKHRGQCFLNWVRRRGWHTDQQLAFIREGYDPDTGQRLAHGHRYDIFMRIGENARIAEVVAMAAQAAEGV